MAPRNHPGWKPVRLRRHREAAGHTQESLAEAVNNLQIPGFRPPHASPDSISDHENGRHYPTAVYRAAYRHALGLTDEELGFRAGPPARVGGVSSSGQDTCTAHAMAWTQPDGRGERQGEATDRRGVIAWAAAALGVPISTAHGLTSDDRLALLDQAAGAAGAVAAAEGILATIVDGYLVHPPRVVLGRLAALQRFADGVQAECLLRPADTARLWRVAGVAAGIRGWLENTASDTVAARSSLREAHRRGDLLDDDRLAAWARDMQAVVEVYAGDPAAAERYALDGLRRLRRAGRRGRPLRAQLLVDHVAEARANRGDADGAEKAVAAAHDIVTTLPAEQHGPARPTIVDSMDAVSPTYVAESAGFAFARLGRPDRFAEVTADARREAERAGTHLRVYLRLTEALAIGRSADPDPERIAALTRDGLALASLHQTAHVSDRLGLVLRAVKPLETHAAVRDLAEYGAAWRSDRLARLAAET
jgi:hypothetical protein